MVISRIADDNYDEFRFHNKMSVVISYADDKQLWGSHGRLSGKWRRIQLFDKRDNLISEIIEVNPTYYQNLPELELPETDEVIY